MSPDELTNQQLLDAIASMRRWIESPEFGHYYARRVELYEEILKERAEDGTYADH